jgi:ubiquinone/menaquinone biosynthesis C-methylase UbiE
MGKLGADQRAGYIKLGVVDGYDTWAMTYDHGANPLVALEERATLEFVGTVMGQHILDLGCGTGRYSALLAKCGAKVIGIDPSAQMLEQAKRKVTPQCQFELCHGTLEGMSFPDEHFDLVLAALTLSHIPELESILVEATRILKRGGFMVISDIHPYWPVSGHDYTEFFDETGQEYRIPEYPHLVEDYWNLFRKFGMRLEELRELRIDEELLAGFPGLRGLYGVPLAMVLKARRLPKPDGFGICPPIPPAARVCGSAVYRSPSVLISSRTSGSRGR